ncbi:MAG: DUF5683 domain-containing protein [bacterium]
MPQSTAITQVIDIQRALQRGDYGLATELADSAIAHFEDFAPAQLAEIHAWRALAALERNETAVADAHFLSTLQLVPDFQLDPIFFSPAVRDRFEQLRAKIPKPEAVVRVETRYVTVADPRVKAAWQSLVLPGWGQRSKGQKFRGGVFTAAAATFAAATLTTSVLRARAKNDYETADESTVVARYDTYNRYHQLRNSFALALGITWSAAVLDALIMPAQSRASPATSLAPRLMPASSHYLVALTIPL